MALIIWVFVFHHTMKSPMGWISPTGLFALGMNIFLIVPSMYWQIRPWVYPIPGYFEGQSIVMIASAIIGIPFFVHALLSDNSEFPVQKIMPRRVEFGPGLWVMAIPVLVGLYWHTYLITLGHQARLQRIAPDATLDLVLGNLAFYFQACYFALFAFGNRAQRRAAVIIWVMDGFMQLYSLHRYFTLLFLLRSFVFINITGKTLRLRHFFAVGVAVVLVVSIIGRVSGLAWEEIEGSSKRFLSPYQAATLVGKAGSIFLSGEKHHMDESLHDQSAFFKTLDNAFFRLYEARSTGAVMSAVPELIPYRYFEPFEHVFYSFIPRYFWPGKPKLSEINRLTEVVMEKDWGLNPVTTLGELYVSYGYFAIFLGGIISFFVCHFVEWFFLNPRGASPAMFVTYPSVFAVLFFAANDNFTRRYTEGLRGIFIIGMIGAVLWACKKIPLIVTNRQPQLAASQSPAGAE
ncbi:hypothetical protein ACFLQ0_02225 [Nitrospinota bacterium]